MSTISIEFVKHQQELRYTRVTGLEDGRRIRVAIRRNSYDFQSSAHADLWTPAGWVRVHDIDGCDILMTAMPTYVTRDLDKAERQLAELAELLESVAKRIIS